jgi:hypothetical protein
MGNPRYLGCTVLGRPAPECRRKQCGQPPRQRRFSFDSVF